MSSGYPPESRGERRFGRRRRSGRRRRQRKYFENVEPLNEQQIMALDPYTDGKPLEELPVRKLRELEEKLFNPATGELYAAWPRSGPEIFRIISNLIFMREEAASQAGKLIQSGSDPHDTEVGLEQIREVLDGPDESDDGFPF